VKVRLISYKNKKYKKTKTYIEIKAITWWWQSLALSH